MYNISIITVIYMYWIKQCVKFSLGDVPVYIIFQLFHLAKRQTAVTATIAMKQRSLYY